MNNKLLKLLFITASFQASAEVKPAALFTDNMVIQQQTDAAIWGRADVGENVKVSASWGESATTVTDASGKWLIKLKTPKALSGTTKNYSIQFTGENSVTINNVAVGEVWLASGQSNMAFTIKALKLDSEQIGDANFPNVREFKVKQNSSKSQASNVQGNWLAASNDSVGNWGGTPYFFARNLYQNLHVPIGIINSSWGGTPIESWLSVDAQLEHSVTQKRIADIDKWAKHYNVEKQQLKYQQVLAKWESDKKQAKQSNQKFNQRKPKYPEHPHKRKYNPSNLYNGMIHPLIPYTFKGFIWYQGEANSNDADKANFYQTQLTSLINGWRTDWKTNDSNEKLPFYVVQLANFKAPQVSPVESKQHWPITRESMRKAVNSLSHSDIAVTIDIGDESNIHPKNKMELGRRLALLALHNDYSQDVVASGPKYKSYEIIDNKIIVEFETNGSALVGKEDLKLQGFAIAGYDGKYVWADAQIISEMQNNKAQKIAISSNLIDKPVAVKYGWANNPDKINLYNIDGLPASPFSTN